MTAALDALCADLPAPWDGLSARRVLYLRHRLNGHQPAEIAGHYHVTEGSVMQALRRLAEDLDMTTRAGYRTPVADLMRVAVADGVPPLPLSLCRQ